jgi:hypothetical protein
MSENAKVLEERGVASRPTAPAGGYEPPRVERLGSLRDHLAGKSIAGTPDGSSGNFRP